MNTKVKDIISRYSYATLGLFFVALGIALSILSDLGTAPLSCPAYVFNLKFASVSVGTFTFLLNLLYIVIQLVIFRKEFKARYWLQIVASAILGYFIDACMWLLSWAVCDSLVLRVVMCLLASFFTAVGISIEVAANAWMLSAEMTVTAFCRLNSKFRFGTVKIVMDTVLVVLSAVASYLFFFHFLGSGDSHEQVIGIGTLVLAFLPGYLIKYTDRLINRKADS